MKLVNLQIYTPDEYFLGEDILYFKDDMGNDWFESLPKFKKKYSLAIDNETGVIRSISEDASRIYPVGLTVVDVDSLPDGCDIFGGWVFNGKSVTQRNYSPAEREAQAQQEKDRLLALATKIIEPLKDAVSYGVATGEEEEKLKRWILFRIQINRVDITTDSVIVWPPRPE
jgi:hypothetical protein